MDSCFSSNLRVLSFEALRYRSYSELKQHGNYIINETAELKTETNKDKFRTKCINLANFIINLNPKTQYIDINKWKGALRTFYGSQYTEISKKYGGCPMILEEENKNILILKYDAEDFCDEKEKKKPKCVKSADFSLKKCDISCFNKIRDYNAWIKNRKDHFMNNKEFIYKKCKKNNPLLPFPNNSCNVSKPETFEALPECEYSDPPIDHTAVQQNKEQHPDVSHDLTINQDQDSLKSSLQIQNLTIQQSESSSDHQGEDQKSLSATPNMEKQSDAAESVQTETTSFIPNSDILPSEAGKETTTRFDNEIIKLPPVQGHIPSSLEELEPVSSYIIPPTHIKKTGTEENIHSQSISSILISFMIIIVFTFFIEYALIGLLKKKKSIKSRQVKLLKILLPSFTDKKSKLLTHDHPEDIIYDEEQIIKKLKIHEHDMIKNIKSSKQKKDRFKTIIEVHMEVLKEFRNEEWEHKKGEFLELCLEMFAEEEYRTYPNLSNGELIMENTKSINDIEKQKILCNKWIKEHRNISEKLKKTVWFNYLKNEWKKEKASIKETEELKMNFSIEIQKISFSEKEKDLWREWISKNRMIIDRFLEQEWDEVLTQELLNMIDECVNEELKNNISLLNTKEVQQKVSYEELYKYIKKKLIAKLCILVFMMVLEECKKEDFIENEGLHLDSYINDWTTEVNLGRKSDVTKEIIEYNSNVLENTENTKIPAYTGGEGLRQEIEKWVRIEDTPENSIYNENIVE
ncbi:STP1 protein [Plasmodium malariae]|uniref:STP1 protein n=1 Tax=Plasmodium malariae TaxID=5858 RepID=A0A1D3JGS6_PLAMA|nr:STP1 protein [Plasmodium malariae]SBT85458.1 STP1 protein [Plasmodium malariae]